MWCRPMDESAERPFFTVLTATHDRAHTLHRPYESLCHQTDRDFEWLIVDDGSDDDTEALVRRWQADGRLSIRFIKRPRTGFTFTRNYGYRQATGTLVLDLDSDDACLPHSLQRFREVWGSIPESERKDFSGVTCLTQDQHGRLIGTGLPADVLDSDYLEIKYRYQVRGERWQCRVPEILRRYPLPEIQGQNFFQEGTQKSHIARHYKERFFSEPLRIYWQDETGEADQVSTRHPVLIADGLVYWHRLILNEEMDWFREAPFEFFRSAVHYSRFSWHRKDGLRAQWKGLDTFVARLLWVFMFPIGFLVHVRDGKLPEDETAVLGTLNRPS